VIGHGYRRLAALAEEQLHLSGPPWLRSAEVLRVVDNYLRSGLRFVYLHTSLEEGTEAAGAMNTAKIRPLPVARRE
jgi:hypothetical protein